MNIDARIKLDMGSRVRDFCVAHPFENPRFASALSRLEDRLNRAQALEDQEHTGHVTASVSTATKAELRRNIWEEPLRHLQRIAQSVAPDDPEVAKRFKLPRRNRTHREFLIAARTIAAEALAQKELFLSYGMTDAFLDDLNKSLEQYDQAVNQVHAGTRAHVGARADLGSVTEEIMRLVRRLDALNRYRFREDPELLAAWISAHDVAWPAREAKEVQPAA